MKRRTELKIENAKIFSKKYIFSSRFVVRNTLCVLALTTLTGSAVFAAEVIGDRSVKEVKPVEVAVIAPKAEEKSEPVSDKYIVKLEDTTYMDTDSIDVLYSKFEDDGAVLAKANSAEYLTQSETDMTGRYIVVTEGLNLRAEATEKGNVLAVLNTGDSGKVIGTDGDWTMVSSDEAEGYVKSEYIVVGDAATEIAKKAADEKKSLRDAIGVDVEETEYAKADETVEETEKVSEDDTQDETVEETTDTEEASETEEATEAETEEATEAPTEEATEEETTEEATEEKVVASDDLYLLAAIVFGEAGNQSYEGQLAVASVVMNRLNSGLWGNTLAEVIYAPYQFEATGTSAFQNALSTGGSETSLKAAQDALNGANNVGGYMYFLPTWNVDTSTLSSYMQIGDHIFF